MRRPTARRGGIVVRVLPDETIVYDCRSHEAHCLNPVAAAVFRAADGTRTEEEIAAALEGFPASPDERRAAARLALDELARAGLLDEEPSRRDVLRRAGLGAALLLPAIVSVVAPTPAEALATCVRDCAGNEGRSCASYPNECSGLHTCMCNQTTCCSDGGGA